MRVLLYVGAALLMCAGAVGAGANEPAKKPVASTPGALPRFNATCPGTLEVHGDAGGPVFVNGKEATLKKFNENYFEAKDKSSGTTISISRDPDGSLSVSYTGRNRANGICQLK